MARQQTRDNEGQPSASLPGDTGWISSRELILVAILIGAGIAIRCAFPSRLAIEHFDEGVYASNLLFPSGQYPFRELYAPWLFPFLTEMSQLALGPTHWGTMFVSVAAGCATLAAVWWLVHNWFGPSAAMVSLGLASLSDLHIVLSRMALTDALLAFWLIGAVFFLERALRRRRAVDVVCCGIATGLAWWTKYNGWLPLAIGLAAIGLLALESLRTVRSTHTNPTRKRGDNGETNAPRLRVGLVWMQETGASLVAWLGIVAVAALMFLPVWSSLPNGYGPVAANHQKYVVGLAGWPHSAERQLANLRHFDGWLSIAAVGLGLIAAAWLALGGQRVSWPRAMSALSTCLCLMSAAAVLGIFPVAAMAALVAAGWYLLRRHAIDAAGTWLVPVAITTVWLLGLIVATPWYTPYPRLTMPLVAASWIGAGLAFGVVNRVVQFDSLPRVRTLWVAGAIGAVALAALIWRAPILTNRGVPAWQDRSGLEQLARQAVKAVQENSNGGPPAFAVYGEPALFFHLRTAGMIAEPVAGLDFASPTSRESSTTIYLAVGPHARRDRQFAAAWKQWSERFELVAELESHPSDAVLLDDFHAAELTMGRDHGGQVELYRLKPAP